jgi:hypothetical protein
MIENVKTTIANAVFWFGYYWYKVFNTTPWYSYLSLRKLFYTSNTQFNRRISSQIAKKNAQYGNISPIGVLGNLSEDDLANISNRIQTDGFYVFPSTLDSETINKLIELSFRTKARLVPKPGDEDMGFFDRTSPSTIKYQFLEGDIVQDPTIQRLISDPSVLAVAQAFLKSKPILDLISMWWSTAFSSKASSEVAQLYHWDMERIKFVKFFFYLTDVDYDSGPHCFIKGSNNGFPEEVRRDGRISDEEIKMAYSPENIIEITGKKGTILAVDTSGLHKGKKLDRGDRLLLQFEFSNSLFGVNSEYLTINQPCSELKKAVHSFPFVFQRYTLM